MSLFFNSRPYKAYAAIAGSDPEYMDCKEAVTANAEKYTYKAGDYPCAKPRELDDYTRLNTDSQISDCYNRLFTHKITHASRHTKIKLPDGALMLRIPGYIERPGENTGYNVNKDCSITVTTMSTSTGFILKQQSMSRGSFNEKYKIDDTPAPTPEPDVEEPSTGIGFIDDILEGTTDEGGLTTKGWMLAGGAAGVVLIGVLVATKAIR